MLLPAQVIHKAYQMSEITFAEWLRTERDRIGMNDSELGRRAGLSKATISEYLAGNIQGKNATLATLSGIAKAIERPLALVIEKCGYDLGLSTNPIPAKVVLDPTVIGLAQQLRRLRPEQVESVMIQYLIQTRD